MKHIDECDKQSTSGKCICPEGFGAKSLTKYVVRLERVTLKIERAYEHVEATNEDEAKILADDRMAGYTNANWEAFDEIVRPSTVVDAEEE